MSKKTFYEIDYYQKYKHKQLVGGDSFLSKKYDDENRIISVLSDGLGSGVKASVLSTLTATMAMNYVSNDFDIIKTAKVIMRTLPVCKTRKISYATFTIVDLNKDGHTSIVEYDNPSHLLVRDNRVIKPEKNSQKIESHSFKDDYLYFSRFESRLGDRIILFSDGVTQSGIGSKQYPLGWGIKNVELFVGRTLTDNPDISARELAKQIVEQAYVNDLYKAQDDITCGVVNVREPRELLLMTGPPINPDKDRELASIVSQFPGNKVICGGTTANIVARELGRDISVNIKDYSPEIPPTSVMDGIDLITEGTITMGKVIEILEKDYNPELLTTNGASKLVNFLLNSDIIHFVVGTKINDAHQDPNVPVELEIRRNIIKHIRKLLEEKHLKDTTLQFI